MKQLEPYEQRMIDEYNELGERWLKMGEFLAGEMSGNGEVRVSDRELRLMYRQRRAMSDYLLALELRMKIHGIGADTEPAEESYETKCDAAFIEWIAKEKADAWREGAVYGFAHSGEGWNGEYMSGIGEPDTCDIERGNASVWHNPYERKA